MSSKLNFAMGNAAMVEGAIAAGARFYAGYPITPSSEIAELSSIRLPQVNGMYIQMEDEIGSIAAIIGASASGKKSYTATSGPGMSLMQENLGVAIMGEVPCVIIDVMRSGPSTGLATKPAQGDVMQARWGTHGDHGIIVLSPSSVQDCYDLMILAFNLAEKYRTPVIFLADEVIAHLWEQYEKRPVSPEELVTRKAPAGDPASYKLYDFESENDGIAPMASYGSKYIFRINGSGHDKNGAPCSIPGNADKFIRHFTDKIETHKSDIVVTRLFEVEDATHLIIAYGCTVRSAFSAAKKLRTMGVKAGVLQLVTLWPFADKTVESLCKGKQKVLVAEMNLGQLKGEIQKFCTAPLIGVNRVDGLLIRPQEIIEAALEEV